MRHITVLLVVLVGALTSTVVLAQDLDPVAGGKFYCLVPGNSADRAWARADCDAFAQQNSYDSGVLMPCLALSASQGLACPVCDPLPDGNRPMTFVCAGISGQKP